MRLLVKTPPTVEPVSLTEAKAHLRVDFDDEDALIWAQVRAVRQHLERRYNRAFCTQTLVLDLDSFDPSYRASEVYVGIAPTPWAVGLGIVWSVLELRPPVQSIVSVKYLDTSATQQTMSGSAYVLDNATEPARLYPKYNTVWPATAFLPGAVKVEFITGTDPGLVPEDAKLANLMLLGEAYRQRETTDDGAARAAARAAAKHELTIDALMGWSQAPLIR